MGSLFQAKPANKRPWHRPVAHVAPARWRLARPVRPFLGQILVGLHLLQARNGPLELKRQPPAAIQADSEVRRRQYQFDVAVVELSTRLIKRRAWSSISARENTGTPTTSTAWNSRASSCNRFCERGRRRFREVEPADIVRPQRQVITAIDLHALPVMSGQAASRSKLSRRLSSAAASRGGGRVPPAPACAGGNRYRHPTLTTRCIFHQRNRRQESLPLQAILIKPCGSILRWPPGRRRGRTGPHQAAQDHRVGDVADINSSKHSTRPPASRSATIFRADFSPPSRAFSSS